jgi:4-cresol dehydrogenase (hydroxylating)
MGVMGIPSLQIFSGVGIQRMSGHMDFSPAYPMTGEHVRKVNAVLQKGFADAGMPWPGWTGGQCWFPKILLPIVAVPVSNDPAENKKFRAAFERLMDVMAEAGYGEYRTHPAFQDRLMSKYNYNNGALLRLHERLKDALDPNGILAAGKNGIWPKHLRRTQA